MACGVSLDLFAMTSFIITLDNVMHKEQISQELLTRITNKAESTIREVISAALTEEINRALTQALTEGEFYRAISTDLQEGLKSIYREINTAATSTGSELQVAAPPVADEMFSEASTQLGAILQTTEKATESIMELVEKHLDSSERAMALLDSLDNGAARPEIAELRAGNQALSEDLMEIMTTLSFQDLTGQRIKRIVAALQTDREGGFRTLHGHGPVHESPGAQSRAVRGRNPPDLQGPGHEPQRSAGRKHPDGRGRSSEPARFVIFSFTITQAGYGILRNRLFSWRQIMPQLSDITLFSLTRTMSVLDQLFQEEPDLYEDFVREICADFTLAREYMLAIQEMVGHEADRQALAQADLTLRHMLALWVLSNDLTVPVTGLDQMQ
jgi:chemotaxis protein CheZ